MGNQPGRAEEHDQGLYGPGCCLAMASPCEMPGLLPAAFGAVTAGLGVLFSGGLTAASYRAEKEAVGRDNAEGFKPASKITTVYLANGIHCCSIPELTASSLGNF